MRTEFDTVDQFVRHGAEFVQFLHAARPQDIPGTVVERARLLVLDSLGALIAASAAKYSAGRIMSEFVRDLGGAGECTVVGRTFRTNSMLAALANGTMGYYCDIEPHNPEPIMHGMAVVLPTCLAVGQKVHSSGTEFLTALILGIEAACRISNSIGPSELYRRGFHPTCVCGGFGAAVAAARLLGLSFAQLQRALGLAATQASGLLAWEADDSENSRPFNAGIAARNGVTAALLAARGFGGPPDVLEGRWNIYRAYAAGASLERLTDGLADEYAISGCTVKKYACCAFTHPGLDALLDIMDEKGIKAEDIDEIVLRFPRSGVALIDNNPLRSHCAQYILAIGALEKKVAIDDFLRDRRREPAIFALTQRVKVIGDDALDALFPRRYPTILEVATRDGCRFSRRVDYAHGTPQNPVTPLYIREKFRSLASPLVPLETIARIEEVVSRLESLHDVDRLGELLSFEQDDTARGAFGMTRRDFIGAAAAAPAFLSQKKRRNLVFILSDDHRFDLMGCMGHPWVQTPHLDRLARGGALFQNAFATTSLCAPSRASILTGLYAHAHGVLDNVSALPPGLTTFPHILQKHGYRTAFFGKWHMGNQSDDAQPGFDRWIAFRGQGEYRDPLINFDGQRRRTKGYVTDILTEEAARFIRQNTGEPFLLYLAHKAVHGPFTPAPRHSGLYADAPIPYPRSMANTEENYRGRPEWVRRARGSALGVEGMHNGLMTFDEFYRSYCRTLMALDESVGQVMSVLEEKGMLNDTLIVYMSDNGQLCGEHGLIDKRAMYEPSMRIPMIGHCPDLFDGNQRVARMVLNLDVAPTLFDAAGVPAPPSLHGRSLLPLLQSRAAEWRTDFLYEYFWERGFPQVPTVLGLRTETESYMQYHGVWDLEELYEIDKDPDQMNNLLGEVRITTQGGRLLQRIQDAALKKRVSGLQHRMERILAETGGRREPVWKA
jgi:N-acetylglucosamine-6-sulfatase